MIGTLLEINGIMKFMETNEDILTLGDPEKVALIFDLLSVNVDDFKNINREKQIQDIVEFLKNEPDPEFFVRKALGSKPVDRIPFMAEYIQIHKQLAKYKEKLEKVEKDRSKYEDDPIMRAGFAKDKLALHEAIESLEAEIKIYEK